MQKKSKHFWKSKFFKKEDASKLHSRMQEILCSGKFSNMEAYQEIPLSDLVDTRNVLFIDWYVPSMKLCIELHGVQHYKAVAFGHQSKLDTELNFISSKNRDSTKRILLLEAGYLFIEISFKDYAIMDESYLIKKIDEVI